MKINYYKVILGVFLVMGGLPLTVTPVEAKGKKPEKTAAQADKPKPPAKDLKTSANDVLNDVDREIHKALPVLEKGANDALNAVDKGVHKVVGSDNK